MEFTTKNCGQRTSLNEFEKDILKEGLLRLKPFMKKNIKNLDLEGFIKNFFKGYNLRIDTVSVESDTLQTGMGKKRSGGDIFRICKYYYPKCTLENVMRSIDYLQANGLGGDKYLKSQVCRQVWKRVYDTTSKTTVFHKEEKDEFNRYVGGYINV